MLFLFMAVSEYHDVYSDLYVIEAESTEAAFDIHDDCLGYPCLRDLHGPVQPVSYSESVIQSDYIVPTLFSVFPS